MTGAFYAAKAHTNAQKRFLCQRPTQSHEKQSISRRVCRETSVQIGSTKDETQREAAATGWEVISTPEPRW